MKKTLLLLALLVAIPCGVFAQTVGLPPCIDSTLAYYVANFQNGCVIGDKIFSGFSGSSVASDPALALQNSAIKVFVDPTALNPGLAFQGGWVAPSGQVNDTLIQFTVTVMQGGNPIEDASLGIQGSSAVGGGFVNIAETLCLGGLFSPGCSSGNTASLTVWNQEGDGDQIFDHTTFTPVMSVDVTKDIVLVATGQGEVNFASLSYVTQNFSETEVPEPATLSLLGTGLIALGGVVRRRLKAKVVA